MKFKYNYVIAGGTGFYSIAYYDLKKLQNVVYHDGYLSCIRSCFKRMLCRVNFNLAINRYVNTPLKIIVYPWIFPHVFDNDVPLCFIFFEAQFSVINTSYLEHLRRKYKNVKLVLYMQDIVASLPHYDIEQYKNRFDLVLSYDKGDSLRYGLEYFPTPYSHYPVQGIKPEKIDVYFCGAGKTRFSKILDVYRKCKEWNLKCVFFITGVPPEDRINDEGLIYDTYISYTENLAYVVSSKCILEIMQDGADGYTPRLWEAIMYEKHLLTNNTSIRNSEFWDPSYIHLINDSDCIQAFIDIPVRIPQVIKDKKTPVGLLSFIESRL